MKKLQNLYKEAYSGLSTSAWLLSMVMFVNRAGTMVMPFMTLYLTTALGYTIGKAGWVMACFGCGAVCGGWLGGKLTDKFGFYFIQLFALIGGGLMFFVIGQLTEFSHICIASFVLASVNEAFRPANSSAITHYSTVENRTRSFALNRLAINVGWAFGGALGGLIASKNYHLLFWIDGTTNILAAVFLYFALAPSKNKATQKVAEPKPDFVRSAYTDKNYLIYIFCVFLYAFTFFQLFTTQPVFFKTDFHLSESYIGILMALNGLVITAFEMVVVHSIDGKRNTLRYISIGSALLGLSYLIFNFFPGGFFIALISTLICVAGEIFSLPFMNSHAMNRTNVHNRGQYAGLFTMAWAVAQVLGPATGSQIAYNFGFTAMWWVMGGLFLVTALGFRLLERREAREQLLVK